jgi:hypothetical protein
MKKGFPEIYINTYFSFFSGFSLNKLLKIQRYKPSMGIWTDVI